MKFRFALMTVVLGSIGLCQAADRVWVGAVDSDWQTSGNWVEGLLPGVADHAFLTNTTGSFAVSLTGLTIEAVGALTVSNANTSGFTTALTLSNTFFAVQQGEILIGQNGGLTLDNGAVMSYWGEATNTPLLNVRDGGEIRINNGGSLLFTNLYSASGKTDRKIYIGNESAGKLAIRDGGTFRIGPPNVAQTNVQINIGYGNKSCGELEMTGASRLIMQKQDHQSCFYVGNGVGSSGTLSLADSALCIVSNAVFVGFTGNAATGIVMLANNAQMIVEGKSSYGLGYGDNAYGELTVNDNAVWDGMGGSDMQFYVGRSGGTGRLNVNGGSVLIRNYFYVGTDGNGYLTITNGYVRADGQYDRGLTVGLALGSRAVDAALTMSGGTLVVWSITGSYAVGAQSGLIIGKTHTTSTTLSGRSSARMTLSGGTVTNRSFFFVGKGMNATGVVSQTGGDVVQGVDNYADCIFVGFGGGNGSYTLSNGTVNALRDVYVGGYPDAEWPPVEGTEAEKHWNGFANFYTNKISEGTLRIEGGSFHVHAADLRVGQQGVGKVVVGAQGSCVVRNILLDTNSSAVVRFEFGPEGLGTLQATNALTINPGAKLEVDASAYTGDAVWVKLIDCASRTGSFALEDIEVIGRGSVRQDINEDIWLHRPIGTIFFLN